MKVIAQDITTVETGIIGHQCNCRGIMGGGVAMAIRNKWPKAYDDYIKAYHDGELILGNTIISTISELPDPPLYIAHLCGQFNFGHRGSFTDYSSLSDALLKMKRHQEIYTSVYNDTIPLYLPYGIGCGLAGGDWKIVEPIIESIMPDVILCKLGGLNIGL